MSENIIRIVPVGDLSMLDYLIAEQNDYYKRSSWALYFEGAYTGDWSYDRRYIEALARTPGREYAEIAPGSAPADRLSDQRRKMVE